MVALELCVGRSVSGTMAGVEMIGQTPALQTQLSSQQRMPHSAVTQHSGPMYLVINIGVMVITGYIGPECCVTAE